MDVRYFLSQRLMFIRQLYKTSTEPYYEIQRKIEEGEEPFETSYEVDGEPSYLEEWLLADDSIQVLGATCLSMLSAILHVYLQTWADLIGKPRDDEIKAEFKKGWIYGFKAYFSAYSETPFDQCPVDLVFFEELTLARNRVQHPESILTGSSHYSESDLNKISHPFFIDDKEAALLKDTDSQEISWLTSPRIRVSAAKLEETIQLIEKFAQWLETGE